MSTFLVLQNIRRLSKNVEELAQLVCRKEPLVVVVTKIWTSEFTKEILFQIKIYQEVQNRYNFGFKSLEQFIPLKFSLFYYHLYPTRTRWNRP